jgi:hypothetical protein
MGAAMKTPDLTEANRAISDLSDVVRAIAVAAKLTTERLDCHSDFPCFCRSL